MHQGTRSFLRSKSSSTCNEHKALAPAHRQGGSGGCRQQLSFGAFAASNPPVLTLLREHGRGSYCAEESAQRNQPSTMNKLLRFSAAPRRLHGRLRALQHSAGRHVEHWPHTHPRCNSMRNPSRGRKVGMGMQSEVAIEQQLIAQFEPPPPGHGRRGIEHLNLGQTDQFERVLRVCMVFACNPQAERQTSLGGQHAGPGRGVWCSRLPLKRLAMPVLKALTSDCQCSAKDQPFTTGGRGGCHAVAPCEKRGSMAVPSGGKEERRRPLARLVTCTSRILYMQWTVLESTLCHASSLCPACANIQHPSIAQPTAFSRLV